MFNGWRQRGHGRRSHAHHAEVTYDGGQGLDGTCADALSSSSKSAMVIAPISASVIPLS
jgi:hypothetical protein